MLKLSLLQSTPSAVIAFTIFLLLIVSYVLGYRLRSRVSGKNALTSSGDLGAINGALLGLLALLLAFTFSMANSRYDTRRQLVIEEANAIGTAILRTEIYPDSMGQKLRSRLKDYVEARIAFYQAGMDTEKVVASYRNAAAISSNIWTMVANYARKDDVTTRTSELVPALNAMIDVTTTRRAAGESMIPDLILYLLFSLCLCSSFLLGYDLKNKFDWVVLIGFSLMLSITIFAILDLDRPRSGLINMDIPNEKIVELRELFR